MLHLLEKFVSSDKNKSISYFELSISLIFLFIKILFG